MVICLHGLGRSASDWDGVRGGLTRFGPVSAPDLPRDGVDAAVRATDAIPTGAVLVGHSLSGVVALHLAASARDGVAAVILTGSFFPPARNGRSRTATLEDYVGHRIALARELAARGVPPRPRRGTARGLGSLARLGLRPETFHATAAAVSAPVLVVHGRRDHHVPVDFALAAAARHAEWTVRILEQGDHDAHVGRPADWIEAVSTWLDALSPPARRPA